MNAEIEYAALQSLPKVRSYDEIVTRIRALEKDGIWKAYELGIVAGYPIYWLKNVRKWPGRHVIHLTAGVHGDEPAGVLGLLDFLESLTPGEMQAFSFTVYPCINAWGYERNQRLNSEGLDINRCFTPRSNCSETRLMKFLWNRRRYDLAVSCHEDFDSSGAYLYELKAKAPFWGPEILKTFADHVPIDQRPEIEGRRAQQGWIQRHMNDFPARLHPESIFLYLNHTRHSITFETPSLHPLASRVSAQVGGLRRCLELFKTPGGPASL
ncbi:MAG: M14 family metallocarboxypeptidase [Verrucomicrobiae bacterium]|nr:M14 family metallocarboxypeptidase [Verrucomicrobiae bacterium]